MSTDITEPQGHCRICGQALNVHELQAGICDSAYCRAELVQRHAHEEQVKLDREQRARAEAHMRDIAEAARIPDGTHLAVVPANVEPISALPDSRRQAIADHIRTQAEKALQEAPDTHGSPAIGNLWGHAELDPEVHATLSAACATCRGRCCGTGGDHAYIQPATMRRYFDAHPDAAPHDIVADYTSYLPDESYTGHCVFQAENGCTLPREMRSDVCNEFLCHRVVNLKTAFERRGGMPVFAVAMRKASIEYSAVIEEGRLRWAIGPGRRA